MTWQKKHRPALSLGTLGMIAAVAACGAGGSGGGAVTVPTSEPSMPSAIAPKTRVDVVANAKVYDASGNVMSCAQPLKDCPPVPVEREFLDKCRLGGFRVVQCGCVARCSGDVVAFGRHYDIGGTGKDCAPANADCSAPPASAAFQDACAEKGHHLDVCGCEWLCSGNPMK